MLHMTFLENCDYIHPLLEILNMREFYKNTVKRIFIVFDEYKLSLQKASLNKNELSKREHEVAKLALEGLTNKEVSEQLFISVNTVKAILKDKFKKPSVKSRVQLEKNVTRNALSAVLFLKGVLQDYFFIVLRHSLIM